MKANRKRYRILIQEPVEALDTAGQPIVTWEDFLADEPAEFTPMGGVEVMRGRQLEAGTKAVFKVNFRTGYTTQMRVLHDGSYYGITHVNPVNGMRRELELITKS